MTKQRSQTILIVKHKKQLQHMEYTHGSKTAVKNVNYYFVV